MSAHHVVVVGGSDAGISAALRARELDPSTDVTVVVGDTYPNFSICGIPYYISGDVPDWHSLAHRTVPDLEATGMRLRLDTTALDVRVEDRHLVVGGTRGSHDVVPYDELVVGTGALPQRPPIHGLEQLGTKNGVFLLHSMDDTFALSDIEAARSRLIARGVDVTQVEMLGEVLPTVDPSLGRVVHDRLVSAGVTVMTSTSVTGVELAGERLRVLGKPGLDRTVDVVLVVEIFPRSLSGS